MQTNLDAAVDRYLRAKPLSRGTRNEYHSTLRKWGQWGGGGPIEQLQRKDVREFLDWVHERSGPRRSRDRDRWSSSGWSRPSVRSRRLRRRL